MGRFTLGKDGRYHSSITINGIRKHVAAKSQRELIKKIDEIKQSNKIYHTDSDTLVEVYASRWLDMYSCNVRPNTAVMYKNIVEKHILPAIGHIPIGKLLSSDIQDMISQRTDKPRTCEQIMLVMKQISEMAVNDELLTRNPCYKIKKPRYKAKEKRPLTDLEKEAIKKADFTNQERLFVSILYCFGLRRGEALALTKSDIDFENNVIHVNKAITFGVNEQIDDNLTKSDYSVRDIPIPDSIRADLRNYISKVDTFILFTKRDGEAITKSSYAKMWNSIVKKMNTAVTTPEERKIGTTKINGLTAHIFRHNYCTMLYYSDVSIKQAVQLIGHANSKLIMDVYSHLDSEKENLSEKLNRAISM